MSLKLLKKNWLQILLIIVAIAALILLASLFFHPKTNLTGNVVSIPTVVINYSNFEKELAKNYIIRAIPDNAKILLKFYNLNSGKMQWESSFILTRANVTRGTLQNPDITLSLNSRYLKELTNKNFCQIIQQARNNGDLGVELGLSEVSLVWKYRAVLRYGSCFGL